MMDTQLAPQQAHMGAVELLQKPQQLTMEQKPIAWMHVLDDTEGIAWKKPTITFTDSSRNPFGVAGVNYKASYQHSAIPLTALQPAPAVQQVGKPSVEDIKELAAEHLYCDDAHYRVGNGGIMGWQEFAEAVLAAAPQAPALVKENAETFTQEPAHVKETPAVKPLTDEQKDAARWRYMKHENSDWCAILDRADDLDFDGGLDEAVDEAIAANGIGAQKGDV